jgi:hypothetical protein
MKKFIFTSLALLLCGIRANAQDSTKKVIHKHPYVNIIEVGVLTGQNITNSYYYPGASSYYIPSYGTGNTSNRISFSGLLFNGFYLNPKTVLGVTVSFDAYNSTIITPISAGIKRRLFQKKSGGTAIMGNFDIGYGTTWLHNDVNKEKTTGGIMVAPSVGYRIPLKSGSALLFNIGYHYQRFKITTDTSTDTYINKIEETRNYNRLSFRLGFEF